MSLRVFSDKTRGLDDALNEIRGVALYEGVGTYSRGVAIAPTPIAGRGSMDVGSPSEREIDVKDGLHCPIELVGALVKLAQSFLLL